MFNKLKNIHFFEYSIFLSVIYFTTHLFSLTLLPVFADEAIYIRWSQLIIDDFSRYLFFPLNDGKTPLFMWLLIPFLNIFRDPLYASRFLVVLIGFGQMLVNGKIAEKLAQSKIANLVSQALTIFLPFWYFHHRMALTDALLTLMFSLSFFFLLQLDFRKKLNRSNLINTFLSGLFLGLAILAKIPALLFIPVFFIIVFKDQQNFKTSLKNLSLTCLAIIIGLAIFLSLKLHPAFGQLFSRGGDFLISINDLAEDNFFNSVLSKTYKFSNYILTYLTPPIVALTLLGFFSQEKKKHLFLFICSLIYLLPIFILGKTVYPRYFLPIAIFFTASASLYLTELIKKQQKILNLIVGAGLIITLISSGQFIFYSLTDTSKIPFLPIDQEQYLHEWSSGHGVKETVAIVKKLSQDKKVLIYTEGFFGTLPDALLMYFHKEDTSHIFIEGIGQPINGIPDRFQALASNYDQILLLANSHRLNMEIDRRYLLASFPRPGDSPSLELWDITYLFKQ